MKKVNLSKVLALIIFIIILYFIYSFISDVDANASKYNEIVTREAQEAYSYTIPYIPEFRAF